jgi:hypothetical protein
MIEKRDDDNCFRIVELAIGAEEVVILGKPRVEDTNG